MRNMSGRIVGGVIPVFVPGLGCVHSQKVISSVSQQKLVKLRLSRGDRQCSLSGLEHEPLSPAVDQLNIN